MTLLIHHWPTKRIAIAAADATVLPKRKIIPEMRKEILFTGHSRIRGTEIIFKRPADCGPFRLQLVGEKQRTRVTLCHLLTFNQRLPSFSGPQKKYSTFYLTKSMKK